MTEAASSTDTRQIIVEEVLPHAPETIWKALTTGELMGRWLMQPKGFEPVVGNRFTYQTTPAGEWDGTIECEVLTVTPNERFAYSWSGGHAANQGYGSRLETVVTFELVAVAGGTRLRLTHSGFVLPRNETAFTNMSRGWQTVVKQVDAVAAEAEARTH